MNVPGILNSIRSDQKLSILVVDDEPDILQVINEILENQNFNVILADSLQKANQIIKDKDISIVLTDLILDTGTGVDLMNQVQKYQPDAKIILMTGKPTIQNAISVIKKGAFDYVVKPFNIETLLTAVKRATDQFILERENIQLNEIMSFYRISEAMGSVMETDRLLTLILDTAISEFKADFAALHLGKPDGHLHLQKSICRESDLRDKLNRFSQELAEDVYYTCKPIIVNEKEAYGRTAIKKIKSFICQPLMSKGKSIGTISLIRTEDIHQFTTGQLTTLSLFAGKAAISIENSKLYTNLEDAYFETVEALANSIEARDKYTAGHTERVWEITLGIAETLNWEPQKIKELKMGAVLHDIGKIGVPDAILNKPSELTPEEKAVMRTHPELGAHIIREVKFLNPALPYVLYHHERYDGKGYPGGLKAEEIPIEGRLLSVVDTFDAITSDRPYRKGKLKDEAIEEIKKNSGTQFDPDIVDAFLKTVQKSKEVKKIIV